MSKGVTHPHIIQGGSNVWIYPVTFLMVKDRKMEIRTAFYKVM